MNTPEKESPLDNHLRRIEMETVSHLKAIRERRGIAASELARRAGVSRQTIYAMEAGSYVPNTTVALLLARVLEVTVEELFEIGFGHPVDAPIEAQLLESGDWAVEGQPLRLCRVGKRVVAAPAAIGSMWMPAADAVVVGYIPGGVFAEAAADPPEEDKRFIVAGCDRGISVARQELAAAGIDMAWHRARAGRRWLKNGFSVQR
jgi:putative molybdopterin biosynthesis protein